MRTIKLLIGLLSLAMLVTILISDKMRPIRVFASYYGCKIAEKVSIATHCTNLPVIAILEQGKPNADIYGIEDPIALSLFFERYTLPDHVYAHRTNSPARAKLYANYYQAFEFDAIWDSNLNTLDIFHYPEHSSMQFYFDQLLALVPANSRLWLDLKNLTPDNKQAIVEYLNHLFPKDQRKRLVIESKNGGELSVFKRAGYKTSYYLPSANKLPGCDEHSLVQQVIANVNQWDNDYISFPYTQQSFVDKCLLPKVREIEQLSWGGLPFAIPNGALSRYSGYIVDHSINLVGLE
ncbi:hypothetical protein [Vibrio rhodolitus]|uniref:hypothetical protein n=1 Tax=Vibrio rhodolitus TaxID=2231649 RepID=UPI000E0C346A|nr:hypothetical protein [Vibrio rhodolitus]